MKAKLMAVLMAVGLGVTGFAATAQAAEAGTRATEDCEHDIITSTVIGDYASDYDAKYHALYDKVVYYCSKCGDFTVDELVGFEIHDYENVYDDRGHMILSYCTVCGARDCY